MPPRRLRRCVWNRRVGSHIAYGSASMISSIRLPRPRFRVGTDYCERYDLTDTVTEQHVCGIVDDVSVLLSATVQRDNLAPSLCAFFEQTCRLQLFVESRWHPLVRPFWLLVRCLLVLIQQLVYPLRRAQIHTRVLALDAAQAGSGRGVVRTYDSGRVFHVFIYRVTQSSAGPCTDVFIPLPWSALHARLRLICVDVGEVCWSSEASKADQSSGVWFEFGPWSFPVPLGESMTLWDAASQRCPDIVRASDREAVLYGRHAQKLWGFTLVEHTYAFRPAPLPTA